MGKERKKRGTREAQGVRAREKGNYGREELVDANPRATSIFLESRPPPKVHHPCPPKVVHPKWWQGGERESVAKRKEGEMRIKSGIASITITITCLITFLLQYARRYGLVRSRFDIDIAKSD